MNIKLDLLAVGVMGLNPSNGLKSDRIDGKLIRLS